MRTGNIFCLSKEPTEFPTVGAIRTISVLPAITKMYELLLLQFLNEEVKRINDIPENQRGFREKTSTFDNLLDLFSLIKGAKQLQQRYRDARPRVPVASRRTQYLLFIDFRKAFDRVNRDILY